VREWPRAVEHGPDPREPAIDRGGIAEIEHPCLEPERGGDLLHVQRVPAGEDGPLVTLDGVVRRWDADLPTANASAYREDGIAELVFETLAALDPHSSSRLPPAFRCPNGPLADIARICQGQPLYDPAKLTMPTLLVRGDDDTTSTHSAAVRLLGEIASPRKRYCVVAPGSHFLCIERNRAKLYEHLKDFFAPIRPSATPA